MAGKTKSQKKKALDMRSKMYLVLALCSVMLLVSIGISLVLIGGIDCDTRCRALDADKNPVPGLYVAGNTMGGRFLVDYPVTVAGASHSMAMSFGRLAGRNAAAGK